MLGPTMVYFREVQTGCWQHLVQRVRLELWLVTGMPSKNIVIFHYRKDIIFFTYVYRSSAYSQGRRLYPSMTTAMDPQK
jgi:hypothetical protein